VPASQRRNVLRSWEFGGFAGLFDASALKSYARPLLATSTDGVGTKVAIAQALDKHDTIGRDLVAMVVDDLVVAGAEPLFLTDYIACGKVDPERIAQIVAGIAAGCAEAGCALGRRDGQHPDRMAPDEYDLAAAGTAVVEADQMLGSHRVQAGDVLVGLAASGLHSNGYSLAQAVLVKNDLSRLDTHVAELGRTVGEAAGTDPHLHPPVSDWRAVAGSTRWPHHRWWPRSEPGPGHPVGLTAVVDRGTWRPLPIFDVIARTGAIERDELEIAFNMGVGMVLVVAPDALSGVFAQAHDLAPFIMGQVRDSQVTDVATAAPKGGSGGTVTVSGNYK
jgi:phosphoribosylformylglycinamidine cyclo-ligase